MTTKTKKTISAAAVERRAEQARARYALDPDKHREMAKVRRLRRADKKAESDRIWRAANTDRKAALNKKWRNENVEREHEIAAARRARKLNAAVGWHSEETAFVMQEASDLCRRRRAATGIAWNIDHMIPLQAKDACGLHVADNLQVIPATINQSKCNNMRFTQPLEWLSVI